VAEHKGEVLVIHSQEFGKLKFGLRRGSASQPEFERCQPLCAGGAFDLPDLGINGVELAALFGYHRRNCEQWHQHNE
jgi:hypothetical protein